MSLPLLFDLTGRRVVAVGGGPVAARRVASFVDEGALVEVIAPWICEDLHDLYAAGLITWLDRDWAGPGDLHGAWLVHTATGEPTVDTAVREAAQAARIWCIDATCADRTDVSVPARRAVATPDGTVTLAVSATGDPRLAVAVAEAFAATVGRGEVDLRRHRARTGPGWVALVGGGPGADALLTARALELLRAADVIVVDRLAPRSILDRLPSTVRVVDVGKAPGHHSLSQGEINDLLVAEALAGRGVVRLKGGDPYVLGRGGEERIACQAHGIPVEVVPGVTSAIAVPAAAGIPVTHRGLARAFTVVTGHDDLPALPPGSDHTLVLLMAVSTLRQSMATLVAHGREPHCPVAIIERGWLPDQRVTLGTLADIADLAVARGVENPAVIVVGDVVTLSPHAS